MLASKGGVDCPSPVTSTCDRSKVVLAPQMTRDETGEQGDVVVGDVVIGDAAIPTITDMSLAQEVVLAQRDVGAVGGDPDGGHGGRHGGPGTLRR